MLLWRRGASVLTAGHLKITRDARFKIVGDYNLQIAGVRTQDAGDYICQIGDQETRDQVHTVEILGKLARRQTQTHTTTPNPPIARRIKPSTHLRRPYPTTAINTINDKGNQHTTSQRPNASVLYSSRPIRAKQNRFVCSDSFPSLQLNVVCLWALCAKKGSGRRKNISHKQAKVIGYTHKRTSPGGGHSSLIIIVYLFFVQPSTVVRSSSHPSGGAAEWSSVGAKGQHGDARVQGFRQSGAHHLLVQKGTCVHLMDHLYIRSPSDI